MHDNPARKAQVYGFDLRIAAHELRQDLLEPPRLGSHLTFGDEEREGEGRRVETEVLLAQHLDPRQVRRPIRLHPSQVSRHFESRGHAFRVGGVDEAHHEEPGAAPSPGGSGDTRQSSSDEDGNVRDSAIFQ